MNKLPYRLHHTLCLLENYSKQQLPLDLYISHYFRENKALGSKDRAEIGENVYGVIRWHGLLHHLSGHSTDWLKIIESYQNFDYNQYVHNEEIPLHVRVAFPKIIFDQLCANYGEDKAITLAIASNFPAPTSVRANTLKTSRETLLKKWESLYEVVPSEITPEGIRFLKKINFFSTPEFQNGLFEVQDEGSQLLAGLVDAKPGDLVMDYCSGSGGKTLAFAPRMKHKGQIYLHDIRDYVLREAKKRLKRSGIQNAQVISAGSPNLKKLKHKMDWVLVDAPCTGTGTLRRNPDMKWRFDEETLPRIRGQQREIFEKALSFVKPGGRIIYGTCSMLKIENEEQTAHFLKTYPIELIGSPFQSFPEVGGMDGFYGVVFKTKDAYKADTK